MSERSISAYKWAVWIFLVAYAVACFQQVSEIRLSPSSTGAIGYVFIPISGAITAAPFGVVGYAIGAILRAWQSRQPRHVIIASVTAVLSVAYIAITALEAINDRQSASTIAQIMKLSGNDLATHLDNDMAHTSRYVLAAIAMHPAVKSETLARIAAIDDVTLHESFGGPPDLMGGNGRGYAVMRLVALNPNVSPETLALLSHSPDDYVLGAVAGNQATPITVIKRLYLERESKTGGYLIEWGLGSNKGTPEVILRGLATDSRDQYTLDNIARNSSTPIDLKKFVKKRIEKGDYGPQ